MDRLINIYADSKELMKLWGNTVAIKKAALEKLARLEDSGAPHEEVVEARYLVCHIDALESWFSTVIGWGHREEMK